MNEYVNPAIIANGIALLALAPQVYSWATKKKRQGQFELKCHFYENFFNVYIFTPLVSKFQELQAEIIKDAPAEELIKLLKQWRAETLGPLAALKIVDAATANKIQMAWEDIEDALANALEPAEGIKIPLADLANERIVTIVASYALGASNLDYTKLEKLAGRKKKLPLTLLNKLQTIIYKHIRHKECL